MKGLALVAIFSLFISGLTLGQVTRYKAIIVGYKDAFKIYDNHEILKNVQDKGFNTIFLYLKDAKTNNPDMEDLGLNDNLSGYPYYLDSVVDFVDKAYHKGIKVFAYGIENDESNLTSIAAMKDRILQKTRCLVYYQTHVRKENILYHPDFKTKKAHFDGIVINVEPWTISNWDSDLCTSFALTDNNTVLGNFRSLVKEIYDEMEVTDGNGHGFFNPYIESGYTMQNVDNVYMGTVQWLWHNLSQTQNFPNGDFSLYCGIQGDGEHYFDIILPETYCPGAGATCIGKDCIKTNYNDICYSGQYSNEEGLGKCYDWYEKHYFSDEMYGVGDVIPIDAAPMLVGHAAHMYDTWVEMKDVMYETYYRPTYCMQNDNYRGYFAFQYVNTMALPHGLSIVQPPINCGGAAITKSMTDTTDINIRQVLLYPNPADKLINLKGLWKGDKSIIYDLNFNTHLTSYSETIDVSALKPNKYILTVLDENGKIVNRQTFLIRRNY